MHKKPCQAYHEDQYMDVLNDRKGHEIERYIGAHFFFRGPFVTRFPNLRKIKFKKIHLEGDDLVDGLPHGCHNTETVG